jgi:hypothetical protein
VQRVRVRLRGRTSKIRSLNPLAVDVLVTLTDSRRGLIEVTLGPDNVVLPEDVEVMSIEPNQLELRLDREVTQTLPVKFKLMGEPAAGARVQKVEVVPDRVQVSGPESRLRSLRWLTTSNVNLNGHALDFEETVAVISPDPLVKILQPTVVLVRVPPRAAELRSCAGQAAREEALSVHWFGTDGMRGVFGEPPLDEATVGRLGRQLGRWLGERGPKPLVVIAGDTRDSVPALASWLTQGLSAAGCTVRYAGVLPTPAVAILVRDLGAAAGIAVSASHNPWPDNGIKIVGADGFKWPTADERELESRLRADSDPLRRASRDARDRRSPARALPARPPRSARRCATARRDAPRRRRRERRRVTARRRGLTGLGADVRVLGDRPTAATSTRECGSLHPEGLAREVLAQRAALGFAFDGDADRAILVDERGEGARRRRDDVSLGARSVPARCPSRPAHRRDDDEQPGPRTRPGGRRASASSAARWATVRSSRHSAPRASCSAASSRATSSTCPRAPPATGCSRPRPWPRSSPVPRVR